jgi:HK97 family phage portal protein
MLKLFDGLKSYFFDDYGSHWRTLTTATMSTDVYKLYASVPYLYRAIDIRAKTIQAIPYSVYNAKGIDVTDNEIYKQIIQNVSELLYRTEAALCLYGRAYWTKDVEQRVPIPNWLLPTLVNPQYVSGKGLTHYDYYASIDSVYSGKHIRFNPDELVRFEYPSLTSEGYYGVAPGIVASNSASTLYGIDRFASGYFDRGAIKATVLSVEGNPTQKHKDELTNWFQSMLSGIRNAWTTAVLSSKVEPVVIGAGIEELKDNDITERREKHICAALGIPHSLVSADAANYSTSLSDRLNFYTFTIIPEVEFLFSVINEQLLKPYGLTFVVEPSRLEAYQQRELQKAEGLAKLVGTDESIMTVNEAREKLELPEIPEDKPDVKKQLTEALLNTGAFNKNEIREFFGLEPVDTTQDENQRDIRTYFNLIKLGTDAGLPAETVIQIINKERASSVSTKQVQLSNFIKSTRQWSK